MFADRRIQPRSLTDSEIEATVADSLARSQARRAESAEPSRWQLARNWSLALGGAALLAIGVSRGGHAVGEWVYDSFHDDDLQAELTQPIGEVADDIRAGNIGPTEVTKFRVGDKEYAWSVASDLTHRDHQLDTADVTSIIEAQQGNPVQAGSEVVVPDSKIDHPTEP